MTCTNCSLRIPARRTRLRLQEVRVEPHADGDGEVVDAGKDFCSLRCLAIWADLQRAEWEAVR